MLSFPSRRFEAELLEARLSFDRTQVGGAREERLRRMLQADFDFVWRSLRRLGVPEADTDDAAQEVFLVAARRLEQIDSDRERAFLFGTAVRVASTFRRSARRHPADASLSLDEEPALTPTPEELSDLSRARAVLQRILDAMNDEQREVFILCELEELAAPNVAGMLGIPIGTVHSRLRSAREAFDGAVKRGLLREQFKVAR